MQRVDPFLPEDASIWTLYDRVGEVVGRNENYISFTNLFFEVTAFQIQIEKAIVPRLVLDFGGEED